MAFTRNLFGLVTCNANNNENHLTDNLPGLMVLDHDDHCLLSHHRQCREPDASIQYDDLYRLGGWFFNLLVGSLSIYGSVRRVWLDGIIDDYVSALFVVFHVQKYG